MHLEHGTNTDKIARTRAYRGGELVAEDFPVANVSNYLDHRDAVVWVDLCAPDTVDLKVVAEELGLHELAVEDAVESHQRPKIDHYRTHDFLSMYAIWLNKETGELETSELAAFITPQALVTVRKDERFAMQKVVDRWDDSTTNLAMHGVGFLLYGLIDFVVDGHFVPSRTSTRRSRGWRTCCSTTTRRAPTCSGAVSNSARASCNCASSCCRCARS